MHAETSLRLFIPVIFPQVVFCVIINVVASFYIISTNISDDIKLFHETTTTLIAMNNIRVFATFYITMNTTEIYLLSLNKLLLNSQVTVAVIYRFWGFEAFKMFFID